MRVCASLFICFCTVGSVTGAAQSLADVARKESERRQLVKDGGRIYTNTDLKPVPAPPDAAVEPALTGSASGAAPAPAAGPSSTEEKSAEEKSAAEPGETPGSGAEAAEVRDQAYWQKRMAGLLQQLDRNQTFADALQNRIDSLAADFAGRDDPAQRAQIGNDRDKAIAELERLKRVLEQDRRAIPELEEEARRAGAPAGWLR